MMNFRFSALTRFRANLVAAHLAAALVTGCTTVAAPTRTMPRVDAPVARTSSEPAVPQSETLRRLWDEAAALRPLAASENTVRFLDAVRSLPPVAPRTVYINDITREYFSPTERAALPATQKVSEVKLDEYRYYHTKYGSPLAYLRAIEFASEGERSDFAGKRILDIGYGGIGHLRLLASLGAHVTGVDPDSYLDALYSDPRDQGPVPPARDARRGHPGTVTLVHAVWPKDGQAVSRVGQGYDWILSKNTLKKGYVRPERKIDKRQQVDFGVSDEVFLRTVFDTLKPGGKLVIYNISPKQVDKGGYLAQADGRSPYSREQFERAGFIVRTLNSSDDAAVRQMGRSLGWDRNAKNEVTDIEANLFALVTVVERPPR